MLISKDIEEMKEKYLKMVYKEMKKRGYTSEEIPKVIAKTGFMDTLNEYPVEQLHLSIVDAVNVISFVAARS